MAVNVCSTSAGYPQTPPPGVTYNYDRPHLLTAAVGMSIPHHPITKFQFQGNLYLPPGQYPINQPGATTTAFYNVINGKKDLSLVVTASSVHTTPNHEAWRIMSTDLYNDQWWSLPGLYDAAGLYSGAQPEGGEWIKIMYPYPVSMLSYMMVLYGGAPVFADNYVKRWKVMGTLDGTTWEVMDDKTLVDRVWGAPWDGAGTFTAAIAAKSYMGIKIIFTKVAPGQSYVTLACHNLIGCQNTGAH